MSDQIVEFVVGGETVAVSQADTHWFDTYNWRILRPKSGYTKYVQGRPKGGGKEVYLHRLILAAAQGQAVDHADGNGLNNVRSNLRLCRQRDNARNKRPNLGRKFKGITAVGHRWRAQGEANGVHFHLGYHATQEEAARAYDRFAIKNFGEFARVNFP